MRAQKLKETLASLQDCAGAASAARLDLVNQLCYDLVDFSFPPLLKHLLKTASVNEGFFFKDTMV